jgi:hypothetical protein
VLLTFCEMKVVVIGLLVAVVCDAVAPVYEATIYEFDGSGVSGKAIVFSAGEGSPVVAYTGFGQGLEPNLLESNCTVRNACGAHIHSGTSCETIDLQGRHYYVGLPVDPWLTARYTSDNTGSAAFSGVLDIGTYDLEGRAFVLHNAGGGRVGCGLLKRIPNSDLLLGFAADGTIGLAEINDSTARGSVVVYQPDDEYVCHYGTGSGLSPSVVSFLNGGYNCTKHNGCGAHIHGGSSCDDKASQGNHFYNNATLTEDPWKNAGYLVTDSSGNTHYTSCLKTGETVFEGKPFILHGEQGGRVACGILQSACGAFKCTSALGDGFRMSRNGRSCKARCIPYYAVELSKTLGFACEMCNTGTP